MTAVSGRRKQISPQWTPDRKAMTTVGRCRRDQQHLPSRSGLGRDSAGDRGLRRRHRHHGDEPLAGRGVGERQARVQRLPQWAVRDPDAFEQASTESAPIVRAGVGLTPLPVGSPGTLAQLLSDSHVGLPADSSFRVSHDDDRLRVESLSDPYAGAAVGGGGLVGGVLRASFGIAFGDMLRDRQLLTMLRVGTNKDDFAAQAATSIEGAAELGIRGRFRSRAFHGARRAMERGGEIE